MIPRIVITPGEPAGIGPDLTILLARGNQSAEVVAVADPELLRQRAVKLGIPLRLSEYIPGARPPRAHKSGRLPVLSVPLATPASCGKLDPLNGSYVLNTLRRAIQGCLGGEFSALVTGPVHKGVINESGTTFTGHTELLEDLSGVEQAVMMLAAPSLRVALVTTHLPLAEVSGHISRERVQRVVRILYRDLRKHFALPSPRILVCGLNPHAGEGGHLGREEIDIIIPVLDSLREEGLDLTGPVPADTAFTTATLKVADAVLAMYHDQGLPVLKHLGFGRSVNVTLGLPFVRTSVDHGTALDLAGTGRINLGSMEEALRMAIRMVENADRLGDPTG